MPNTDWLATLLRRADVQTPVFPTEELRAWPDAIRRCFLEHQLLREVSPARSVVCDACGEGHIEPVILVEDPPGSLRRTYIWCPEAGRVPVSFERLRQWEVDWSGLGPVCPCFSVVAQLLRTWSRLACGALAGTR